MADISSPDRVGVKVWPDARGFLSDLRKTLKRVEKQVKANIPVVADTDGLAGEAKKAAKTAKKAAGKIEVPAGLEDGFIAKMRRDLKAATAKLDAEIPLTADGERMRRETRAAVASIQAQMQAMSIEVPLDIEEAAAQKAQLKGQIAMLQSMADDITVGMEVDSAGAQAEVRRAHASMQAAASANPVEIPVRVDTSGLERLRSAMSGMKMPAMPSLSVLPKATAIAAIGVAALGSLPAVAALSVGIGQMSTALLALPAVAVGAVAGVAAIAIGLSGVGEAFKTAGEGGEKYAEAMSKLAPSARTFVTSVRSMGDGFSALRLDVQQNLFRGLGAEIKALGTTYLPTLRAGLSGTADAINGVVREWSAMARTPAAVADTGSMFDNINAAIGRASGGITDFSAGLRRLAEIGSGVLPDLSDAFTRLGERFDAWTAKGQQSGSIEESIRRGGQAAKEVGSIFVSLGSIIGGVFTALSNAIGGSPLAALASGLERVAGIVQGPAFQTGLTTFFEGMRDGWGGIKSGLGDLGRALGEIAPGLADLSRAFGEGLGTVLSTIAGLISSNKDTINAFFQSFADASPLVQGLVVGFTLLAPVIMSAISAVVGIVGAIAAIGTTGLIIGAVVAAVVALGVGLFMLYQKSAPVRELFSTVASTIMPMLQQAFATLMPILTQIGQALLELGSTIATVLLPVFQFLAPFIRTAFTAIVTIIQGALTMVLGVIKLFTALLKGDWSAAWSALGTILSGVWMVIKGIVLAALNNIKLLLSVAWMGIQAAAVAAWNGIKAAIGLAWAGIKAIVMAQVNTVKAVMGAAWNGIKATASAAWNGVRAAISAAWNGIKAAVSAGGAAVRALATGAWNGIRAGASAAWSAIRAVISAVWAGIRATISAGASAARSLVSSAWNGIKAVTSAVWSGIRSAISSAWSGIRSAVSSAVSAVRSTVSSGFSRIRSTASSAMSSIRSAISSAWAAIRSAVSSAISAVRSTVSSGFSAVRSTASNAISAVRSAVSNGFNAARSAVSNAISSIRSTASNGFSALRSTVSNAISNVVQTVRSLPSRARNVLGNLGNTLKSAGRALIQGLINGITEKIGALKNKMSSLGKIIKNRMPGSPVKEGPLRSWNHGSGVSAAGRRLAGGIAEGMDAELRSVAAASNRVAAAASGSADGVAASYASRPSMDAQVAEALAGWQPVVNLGSREFAGAMKRTTNDRKGRG